MSDALIAMLAAVVLGIGGGTIAYIKWLQDRADKRRIEAALETSRLSNGKLKAEDAVWKHVQTTIDRQGTEIDKLKKEVAEFKVILDESDLCVRELEKHVADCTEERELLREQNVLLYEEKTMLQQLLEAKE